jgi:hypothetical protein
MSTQLDNAVAELRAAKAELDEKVAVASNTFYANKTAEEAQALAQTRFDSARLALPDAALIED